MAVLLDRLGIVLVALVFLPPQLSRGLAQVQSSGPAGGPLMAEDRAGLGVHM